MRRRQQYSERRTGISNQELYARSGLDVVEDVDERPHGWGSMQTGTLAREELIIAKPREDQDRVAHGKALGHRVNGDTDRVGQIPLPTPLYTPKVCGLPIVLGQPGDGIPFIGIPEERTQKRGVGSAEGFDRVQPCAGDRGRSGRNECEEEKEDEDGTGHNASNPDR